MPQRNRVNPFGEVVAASARGRWMGNRGCLHDDRGQVVRQSAATAWIICDPRWPGPPRPLFAPGLYTPLFFLDEATALAAGHRPCGECRAEALKRFKQAWRSAFGLESLPRVADIDRTLARQRGLWPACPAPGLLPEGAMVADRRGRAWLRRGDGWLGWSFAGYGPASPVPPSGDLALLTPAATVAVLAHGYRPDRDLA